LTVPQSTAVDAQGLLANVGAIAGSFLPGIGTALGGIIGGFVGGIVDGLFSSKHTSTLIDVEQHYDIFTGRRSVIGIAGIGLSQRQYASESQYISRVHTFGRELQAVSLIATENIPADRPIGML
jgi:hypothetical protein